MRTESEPALLRRANKSRRAAAKPTPDPETLFSGKGMVALIQYEHRD